MEVTAYIFKSIYSQLIRMLSELVPFVYNDYVSKGRKVVPSTLKEILTQLLAHFEDVRLVLDGIDELPQGEHRTLVKTICEVTNSNPTCKTLIDMDMVVDGSLREINNMHEGFIKEPILQDLKGKILEKANGMLLWVRLVLDLLENAISVQDLCLQLNSLPRDLIEVGVPLSVTKIRILLVFTLH
ncbi:hypothetical protein F4678DRAFT_468147 [Xylaria arbuscula]|nr:hypothetical protein F4678DRAFT_468147 [Xylaria arbuscula]